MKNIIKIRLLELGKKQIDLLAELERRGISAAPTELYDSINERLKTPKGTRIRTECLNILDEWEKKEATA